MSQVFLMQVKSIKILLNVYLFSPIKQAIRVGTGGNSKVHPPQSSLWTVGCASWCQVKELSSPSPKQCTLAKTLGTWPCTAALWSWVRHSLCQPWAKMLRLQQTAWSSQPPKSSGSTAHSKSAQRIHSFLVNLSTNAGSCFMMRSHRKPESRQHENKHNQPVLEYCLLLCWQAWACTMSPSGSWSRSNHHKAIYNKTGLRARSALAFPILSCPCSLSWYHSPRYLSWSPRCSLLQSQQSWSPAEVLAEAAEVTPSRTPKVLRSYHCTSPWGAHLGGSWSVLSPCWLPGLCTPHTMCNKVIIRLKEKINKRWHLFRECVFLFEVAAAANSLYWSSSILKYSELHFDSFNSQSKWKFSV